MADKKMNEWSTAGNTNTAYLYGETSTGSQVKVENYMKSKELFGDTTDCNTMKTEGRYVNYQWKNEPSGVTIGILEVMCYQTSYILQRFTFLEATDPVMYIRRCAVNSWSAWKKVTTT